jgi:hypothetical protein
MGANNTSALTGSQCDRSCPYSANLAILAKGIRCHCPNRHIDHLGKLDSVADKIEQDLTEAQGAPQ